MSSSLSSDLASLKIDRASKPSGGGPLGKIVLWLCVLGAVAVAITLGMPYLEARFFKTEVALTEVALISPAQAQIALSSSGYVVPQVRSRVGARIPGRVAKLHAKEGDRVTAGQVVIELDSANQEAAITAAKMRVAAAKARAATARASYDEVRRQAEREHALVKQGAAPQARADDLTLRATSLSEQIKASDAEVAAAVSEIDALKINLGYMTIVSPITGTVLNKPPEVGEVLGNDFGIGTTTTGTIEIADFDSLAVETDVPEGRLHVVKIGSPCEIVLDAYPQRRYRGEAIEIMPRVNRSKATVGVKVKFLDAAQGALPDMAARVSFLNKRLDETEVKEKPKVVVPAAAVVERSGSKVVFVIAGDKAQMKPVSLGPKFGDGFELELGPEPGTKLVKAPPVTLEDGQKIKERSAS
jgi:HlyD family secretion protein